MNLIAAFVLASFVAAPVPKADPAKDALESLQGEWTVVESVRRGVPIDAKLYAEAKVVIKGNTLTALMPGHPDDVSTFTLDPKTTPGSIDLKPSKREVSIKGIYKLEKDRLTICIPSSADDERPKEFKSLKDSNIGLLILERVKK